MGLGYVLINRGIHRDKDFKALTPDQQLLYFKLLSHPYGNKAGFFILDLEETARLMRWTKPKLLKNLKADTPLWEYDETTDVVLLPNYLKYNKLAGCKSLTGLKNDLEQLPKTHLCVDFVYKLNEHTEGEGLAYLPHRMVETAKALTKDQGSIRDAIVFKILSLY